MTFDTLDYIHFLIAVAWLAAAVSGFIEILTYRALLRRTHAPQLSSTAGRWILHTLIALMSLVPAAGFAFILAFVWLNQTHDFFALVRLGYYQIAAASPLLGLYLMVQSRRRNPVMGFRSPIAVSLLLMSPAPICAYASFVAPHRLVVERTNVSMPRMKTEAQPIRIAVLADLQTAKITDYERGAIDRMLSEKPNLILMPGDFFQCSWRQWKAGEADFRAEMARIACPAGAFAVLGDVDDYDDLSKLLSGTPVRLLHNDVQVIDVHGTRVAIGGVELEPGTSASDATIRRLAETACDVRILIAHRPDAVFEIEPGETIDLVVAGHTHGGQIVIPGFGPPVTLTSVPRAVAAGGLHHVNGHRIYVSRGVGCERGSAPPVRFFCPPELSILTVVGGRR